MGGGEVSDPFLKRFLAILIGASSKNIHIFSQKKRLGSGESAEFLVLYLRTIGH